MKMLSWRIQKSDYMQPVSVYHLVFGNCHAHYITRITALFAVVGLFAKLGWDIKEFFFEESKGKTDRDITLSIIWIFFFVISLICMISLLIGNILRKKIFYMPAIFILRPLIILAIFWNIYEFYEMFVFLRSKAIAFRTAGHRRYEFLADVVDAVCAGFNFPAAVITLLVALMFLNSAAKDYVWVKKQSNTQQYLPANTHNIQTEPHHMPNIVHIPNTTTDNYTLPQ